MGSKQEPTISQVQHGNGMQIGYVAGDVIHKKEPFLRRTLNTDDTLVKRNDLVKKLVEKIKKNNSVNLWGIGGLGKTSLARLCIQSDLKDQDGKEIKNLFGSYIYIHVEHNIERDTVSELKCYQKYPELKDINLDDDVTLDFTALMTGLHDNDSIPDKINLLIFDINDTSDDDKGVTYFFNNIRKNNIIIPAGWKILLITHSKYDNKGMVDIDLNKEDKQFALDLFNDLCPNVDAKVRDVIIDTLFYNPLLISVVNKDNLAYIYNLKEFYKSVRDNTIVDQTGHPVEIKVKNYLNNLVCLNKLNSKNKQIIVILFMLWPSDDIPKDVIFSLLQRYCIETTIGDLPLSTDHIMYTDNHYAANKVVASTLDNELDELVKCNILVKNGDSFQMHRLLADVFRSQYYKKIRTLWFKCSNFFFSSRLSHTDYIIAVKSLLNDLACKSSALSEYRIYLECIVYSIPWILEYDVSRCGKMTEMFDIQKNHLFLLYNLELDFKKRIKSDADNPEKLFNTYIEFGDFYLQPSFDGENIRFQGFRNSSLACNQYVKAVEVYENNNQNITDHTNLCHLYLKCCELSDDKDIEYEFYKKAVLLYANNNSKYKLDAFEKKLISVLSNHAALNDRNDSNLADFYYSLGRFYEMDYWSTHKSKRTARHIVKAKHLFAISDSIWASLPPETEGELKGFVKTSYGIYDPRLHYKLVKVEKGSFDMGISEEEFDTLDASYKVLFERSKPQHNVAVGEDFYIGMYPVTQGQWELMRELFGHSMYSIMRRDGELNNIEYNNNRNIILTHVNVGGIGDDYPMNYVNWNDANNFVENMNKLGKEENLYLQYYLPTEMQWEYAARGGKKNEQFPYSGGVKVTDVAVCEKRFPIYTDKHFSEGEGPERVGTKMPNSLGLYDMSGNVLEWCYDYFNKDWYQTNGGSVNEEHPDIIDYEKVFRQTRFYIDGALGVRMASGASRVLRGGSWYYIADGCRVSYRYIYAPDSRSGNNGFRLLLSSPKKEKI